MLHCVALAVAVRTGCEWRVVCNLSLQITDKSYCNDLPGAGSNLLSSMTWTLKYLPNRSSLNFWSRRLSCITACMSWRAAICSLVGHHHNLKAACCARLLTGAVEDVSKQSGLNERFLGLIVLPIAGNACEHITAIFVAVKNKMDLAIGVALGSSIQASDVYAS